jgi:hypothetical protein
VQEQGRLIQINQEVDRNLGVMLEWLPCHTFSAKEHGQNVLDVWSRNSCLKSCSMGSSVLGRLWRDLLARSWSEQLEHRGGFSC